MLEPRFDLRDYGLSARRLADASCGAEQIGRVVSQSKDLSRVISSGGECTAGITGKLRYAAQSPLDFPAVGDFVVLCGDAEDGGARRIGQMLPRTSVFVRKAAGSAAGEQVVAANIDTVFLCMSLNRDFSLRRLERYLTIGWDSGATPVVVLTKADLGSGDASALLLEAKHAAAGAEVLAVSALSGDGCDAVRCRIRPGETAAFLGSSGVGKSTLVNRLLGNALLETGGVRCDGRGRHTTTRRELLLLPGGGLVIDTPGMRELGMWDVSEGLNRTFSDVERFATDCRFRDCSHTAEPGCAVRAAIGRGELPEERLRACQKLRQEAAYAADEADYLAKKRQWSKNIAKINKAGKRS